LILFIAVKLRPHSAELTDKLIAIVANRQLENGGERLALLLEPSVKLAQGIRHDQTTHALAVPELG